MENVLINGHEIELGRDPAWGFVEARTVEVYGRYRALRDNIERISEPELKEMRSLESQLEHLLPVLMNHNRLVANYAPITHMMDLFGNDYATMMNFVSLLIHQDRILAETDERHRRVMEIDDPDAHKRIWLGNLEWARGQIEEGPYEAWGRFLKDEKNIKAIMEGTFMLDSGLSEEDLQLEWGFIQTKYDAIKNEFEKLKDKKNPDPEELMRRFVLSARLEFGLEPIMKEHNLLPANFKSQLHLMDIFTGQKEMRDLVRLCIKQGRSFARIDAQFREEMQVNNPTEYRKRWVDNFEAHMEQTLSEDAHRGWQEFLKQNREEIINNDDL